MDSTITGSYIFLYEVYFLSGKEYVYSHFRIQIELFMNFFKRKVGELLLLSI